VENGNEEERGKASMPRTLFFEMLHTLDAKGKSAVIQSFVPFLKGVDDVKLKQIIEDNGNACAIVGYVYVNSKGEKLIQDVAEVWEVHNGKLAKLTIYFDLTAYRSFMRG
jgi:ketosteroid isomerase-like protein